jgi:hypothetical protein
MKRLFVLMLSIWVFGLILTPQSVEAEMTELAENQMKAPMFPHSVFSLGLVLGSKKHGLTEIKTERDDLFDGEEEAKLNTHLRETFTPDSEWTEHTSHRWERVNAVGVIFGFEDAERNVLSRGYDIQSPSGDVHVREP